MRQPPLQVSRPVRFAPADLPKSAGAFDLPIALGMLVATGQLLPEQLAECATVGELALDGSVRPVKGILSMAMGAKARGVRRFVVPAANAREAAVVEGIDVFGAADLGEAVGLLSGAIQVEPLAAGSDGAFERLNAYDVDFADLRGQESAKRALVVAPGGGHNPLTMWTNTSSIAPRDEPTAARHECCLRCITQPVLPTV